MGPDLTVNAMVNGVVLIPAELRVSSWLGYHLSTCADQACGRRAAVAAIADPLTPKFRKSLLVFILRSASCPG